VTNPQSVKAARSEWFPRRAPGGIGVLPSSPFSSRCRQKIRVWSMLLHLRLLLCVQSLVVFRRAPTPPQCRDTRFPQSDAISSSRVSLKVSLIFPMVSSRSCCLLMPLSTVLSILRCNCSSTPQSLIPLLSSWPVRCLLSSVRPLGVPLATLSLPGSWRPYPLRHAGVTRQVSPLQAKANFFRDPLSPWVCVFGWPRRLISRCRSPCRFFGAPRCSTAPYF
jgi:hypothetical protein